MAGSATFTIVASSTIMSEQMQIRPRDSQRFFVATGVSEGPGWVGLAAFRPVASASSADAPARSASARFSTTGAGARLQTRVSGPRVWRSSTGDSMRLPVSGSGGTDLVMRRLVHWRSFAPAPEGFRLSSCSRSSPLLR